MNIVNLILKLLKAKKHLKEETQHQKTFDVGSYIVIPYCQGTICRVTKVDGSWIYYKYLLSTHYTGDYMRGRIGLFQKFSETWYETRLAEQFEIDKININQLN